MNPQLLHELAGRTWAMDRTRLEGILRSARAGATVPAKARASAVARAGAVAVIPIVGCIDRRDSFFLEVFGGTSIDGIRNSMREALADPAISGIVFLVDSPGGVVDGTPELADDIFKARGRKPMVAAVDSSACSAAYWLASQADEVLVSRYSCYVGSVGVYAEHEDYSRALDQAGVTITLISAGDGKTDANPYEPLTAAARSDIQQRVDEFYGTFVAAVARGRNVKAAAVKGDWKAGVYGTKDAIRLGIADRIGSFDEAIARAASGKVGMRATRLAVGGAPVSEATGVGTMLADDAPVINVKIDGSLIDDSERATQIAREMVAVLKSTRPVKEAIAEPVQLGSLKEEAALMALAPKPLATPTEHIDTEDCDLAIAIARRQLGSVKEEATL